MDKMAKRVDLTDPESVKPLIRSSVGTKFSARYGDLVADLALEAVRRVTLADESGRLDIDTKRYARVEKLPGGELDECRVLDGIMIEKDVTHPVSCRRGRRSTRNRAGREVLEQAAAERSSCRDSGFPQAVAAISSLPRRVLPPCQCVPYPLPGSTAARLYGALQKMKRRIVKPRIILLDCPLEYKKAESAANLELAKEEDFEAILRQEEEHIAKLCADILAFKVGPLASTAYAYDGRGLQRRGRAACSCCTCSLL